MAMPSKLNVILMVLDSVRADHIHSYGYLRNTTPNIDRLASQAVLYEKAFTAAAWSPPAHASLFTGKYPSRHGTLGKNVFLLDRNTTIAEVLSVNGYETLGITANDLIGPTSGFDKGFQKYIHVPMPFRSLKFVMQSPKDFFNTLINGPDRFTSRTMETIKNTLKRRRHGKPFFLFTNLFNCHAPYDPPYPFKSRFCNSFYEFRFYLLELVFSKMFSKTTERLRDPCLNIEKLKYIASDEGQFAFMANELDVSEKEWEVVKSWYDGEIAYLDHQVGEFINFMQDEEIFDNTLLVITSDHGDNFGEHGLASHHFNLYDSLIHVPLIFSCPAIVPGGKKIKSLVSLVDIFPTILRILGIEENIAGIQGKSLYPFEHQRIHDFICAESGKSVTKSKFKYIRSFKLFREKVQKYDKGLKCLRTKSYKYILSSDQKEELYDLQSDPLETTDISHNHVDKVKQFRESLKLVVDISFFGPTDFPQRKESEEILDRLRALGYL